MTNMTLKEKKTERGSVKRSNAYWVYLCYYLSIIVENIQKILIIISYQLTVNINIITFDDNEP